MMRPMRMTVFVGGRRYAVEGAQLLAFGEAGDGETNPQTFTFLLRTPDGRYFVQHRLTPGSGDPHNERVWMEPLEVMDAMPLFAELAHKEVSFDEAFGG